jgi:cytidylate kinase
MLIGYRRADWCPQSKGLSLGAFGRVFATGDGEMSVVAISRGTFSGGKRLAECLAGHLGYRCIDRDVIVEKAAAWGASQQELRDALEKPPAFLERFRYKRYLYLALVQAALTEELRGGEVVYHGHCGHLLLKGGPPVLRARIIAPLGFRISIAQDRLRLNRNEVTAYIKKMDNDRKKWTQYLYGVDWEDASLYDLVINLEYIDIEQACNLLISAVTQGKCYHFDRRCRAVMDDLACASRIKAELALNPDTSNLELEVVCNEGDVRLKGKVHDTDQIEQIERIARQVKGVTSVNLEELAPPVPT